MLVLTILLAAAPVKDHPSGDRSKNGGAENFLAMIREVGAGQSFASVLQRRYDRDLEKLQENIEAELKDR